jgi:hypothetical protein
VSRPDSAVFRLPLLSALIPFLAFVCITPLANAGGPAWLAFYLFPVAGLAYILITRTVADQVDVRAIGFHGVRRIAWSDLDGLEFHGSRWATAVALDGRRTRLPMVRPRDMYRLAAVSGGALLIGKDAPVPEPDPAQDTGLDEESTAVSAKPDLPGSAPVPAGSADSAVDPTHLSDGSDAPVRTPAGVLADDE